MAQRDEDRVVCLRRLRADLLLQLRDVEFGGLQVGSRDFAAQPSLARERNGEADALVARVSGAGVEEVRLTRDVRGDERIGNRGRRDDGGARLFDLRAGGDERRVARERLTDRVGAGEPQRLLRGGRQCKARDGNGNRISKLSEHWVSSGVKQSSSDEKRELRCRRSP